MPSLSLVRALWSLFLTLEPGIAAGEASPPISSEVTGWGFMAAALAVVGGCIPAGIAVGFIGAAAMGTIGERPELIGSNINFCRSGRRHCHLWIDRGHHDLGETMKITVIGQESLRLGFQSAAADFIVVENPPEALQRVQEICSNPRVGIVLITTTLVQPFRKELDHLRSHYSLPLILEIPDLATKDFHGSELHESVSRAMGLSYFSQ